MLIKTSVTRILRRLGAAVITSGVVTFIALYPHADAEIAADTCSLSDVNLWQVELADPTVEQTPAHVLAVTETFIAACPSRPERPQAHQVAAMAAVDMGAVDTALAHFAQAGYLHEARARYYHAAALLAAGLDHQAWAERDALVSQWRQRLARDPRIQVASTEVAGGVIHTVTFLQPLAESGIATAWVAVPDGAGWPATLTLGSERQRAALHRLAAGTFDAPDDPVRHIDYYRCRGRTLLGQAPADMTTDRMADAADVTLRRYLADPDLAAIPAPGTRPQVCLWPHRLLPAPSR